MDRTSNHSHSHFSSKYNKRNLKINNKKDLDDLESYMVATRDQNNPDDMERVRRMVYGGRPNARTSKRTKTTVEDHKLDHDLDSTIEQIKNSTGKYKHRKSKKSHKDNYVPKSILDLENSGKLPKSGGLSLMPIMIGVVFVAVILILGMPMLEQMNSIDTNLGGQNTTMQTNTQLIEDNMFTIIFILPIVLLVLIIVRMF